MIVRRTRILVASATLALVAAGLAAPAAALAAPPGTALAWGRNQLGQLGDGSTTDRPVPAVVCPVGATTPCAAGRPDAVAVSAGGDHTLWLLADGTVAAAGRNASGELGDGTTTDRSVPVRVCAVGATAPCTAFLSGVTAVAAGRFASYALLADGSVIAWGADGDRQQGTGGGGQRPIPGRVCAVGATAPCSSFLTGVSEISTGLGHVLAVLSDGTVAAWGRNQNGQLGDDTTTNRSIPVRVCAVDQAAPCQLFLDRIDHVAAGNHHSVASRDGEFVLAWGDNGDGRLGAGTTGGIRPIPGLVCGVGSCDEPLSEASAIAASEGHSLALLADGTVASWGDSTGGIIGDGTFTDRPVPVRVCAVGATAPCSAFLSGVTDIDAGPRHSVANAGGLAHAWGWDDNGRLGNGATTDQNVPVRSCPVGATPPCATFLSDVSDIDAGESHTAAIATPQRADLSIDLAASAPLLSGAIDYRITVTNTGPNPTASGTITLRVPDATTTVSSTTCSYTPATRTASCPIGVLAAGASGTHTVRATLGLLTLGLALPATATRASSTPTDPNPANDTDTATCTVLTGLIILC